MFYHAKNGTVCVRNSGMDYISFGNGSKILIMLPRLGDGLATVKGCALLFSMAYRIYAKQFTIYVFSRKNHLPEGYSTRDMAKSQAEAMAALGISKAYVLGISQGGMIAQYLAIDYPKLVDKLVLVVTSAKPNKRIKKVIGAWMEMAASCLFTKALVMQAMKKQKILIREF